MSEYTPEQKAKIGAAINEMMLTRNEVMVSGASAVWIKWLSKQLTFEQALESLAYYCTHRDGYDKPSVAMLVEYFEKSPDKQAELQWAYLNTGAGFDETSKKILDRLIGSGNSLDKMNHYERSEVRKQFIAIHSEIISLTKKRQIEEESKKQIGE